MKSLYWLLFGILLLTIAACGGGGKDSAVDDDTEGGSDNQVCTPLVTRQCICGSNESGEQTCNLDGDGWGACSCETDDTIGDLDGGDIEKNTDTSDTTTGNTSTDSGGDSDTESGDGTDTALCTSGRCCDVAKGAYFPLGYQCDTRVEYRCEGNGCGDDAQVRTVEQQCTGTSAACDGLLIEYGWKIKTECGDNMLCEINTAGESQCTSCGAGMWCNSDACDTCNVAAHCGPDCLSCEHGCDGDSCYPECNPESDNCCAEDGTMCTDNCDGTSCCEHGFDGVACYPECNPETDPCCDISGNFLTNTWHDPVTDLCWQIEPTESSETLFNAMDYCVSLGPGWRLPKIEELKTLVTDCPSIADCSVHSRECPSSSCVDACTSCADEGACAWDSEKLKGSCDYPYWSSSNVRNLNELAEDRWAVDFKGADIIERALNTASNLRCVRSPFAKCSVYLESFDGNDHAAGYVQEVIGGGDAAWSYGNVNIDLGTDGVLNCNSGNRCLATNRTGDYDDCESAAVDSPVIDLSFCSNMQLTFYQWYKYAAPDTDYEDGALVEISDNDQENWTQVVPNSPYQYQGEISGKTNVTCERASGYVQGKPGWTGTQNGNYWHKVTIDIPEDYLTPHFKIRFVHGSDYIHESYGWVIDDIEIGPASGK